MERHLERDYAIMDILYDAGLISEKFPRSCSKNDLTTSSTHTRTKGLPLKWFDDHWTLKNKGSAIEMVEQCEVLYTTLRALPNCYG